VSSFTHAVISDTELIFRRGTGGLTILTWKHHGEIEKLVAAAEEHKLSAIWVVPGSQFSDTATNGLVERVGNHDYDYRVRYRPGARGQGHEHIMHARIWRKSGQFHERRSIFLNFPEWDLWEWEEDDAISLLAAIHYDERALGISIAEGPALAGRELMKITAPKNHSMSAPKFDLSTLNLQKSGKDLAWKRQNLVWRPGLYIHAFDKNSQYLGAGRGLKVGVGEPVHHAPGSNFTIEWTVPGLWRCSIDTTDCYYDGVSGPCALARGQEWISTSLLKLCVDLGYKIEILEGYSWPEYSRMLEPWATLLWKSRMDLKTSNAWPHAGGARLAAQSIKTIATKGAGLLASDHTKNYDPDWYRPDWWIMLVELAKERLFRQLMRLVENGGQLVAVAVDCLYFVSEERNPDLALPGLTARAKDLGGYKVAHSVPLSQKLVDRINAEKTGGGLARVVRLAATEECY
jgi:hypothetical protein